MQIFDALIIGQDILSALAETLENAEEYLGEEIQEATLYVTGAEMAVPMDYAQMQLYEALLTDRFLDLDSGVEDVNFYLSDERAGVLLVVRADNAETRMGIYQWLSDACEAWEELSPMELELSESADFDDDEGGEDDEEESEEESTEKSKAEPAQAAV